MPAYHAYLPGMYAAGPTTARPGHVLIVEIDERRSLTSTQPSPFHGADGRRGAAAAERRCGRAPAWPSSLHTPVLCIFR